jgi:hypothetical protein
VVPTLEDAYLVAIKTGGFPAFGPKNTDGVPIAAGDGR